MSSRLLALAVLLGMPAESLAGPPIDAPAAPPPVTMMPTPPPVPAFYRTNPYDYSQYYDVSRQYPCPPPRVVAPPSGDPYFYTPPAVLWGTVSPYYLRSYQVGFPPYR